jgi:hypothetical protein
MGNEEGKEISILRNLFRNELTWVVSIIVVVWAFVATVVLPLNRLQVQVEQIQQQLNSSSSSYSDMLNQIKDISDLANSTKTRLDDLINSK